MEGVVVVEDESVQRKINQTAKKLKKKYQTQRHVDEKKLLSPPKLWKKIFSVVSTIVTVFLVLFASTLSLSVTVAHFQNTVPTYAGVSMLEIATGSMTATGFDEGDTVVVKKVDGHSLKKGDIIAFYVYHDDYQRFYNTTQRKLVSENSQTVWETPFTSFFGFHNSSITKAAQAGATIVFHEIVNVLEDENNERWFVTKGSSNETPDNWITSENMVIGKYNTSTGAKFVLWLFDGLMGNTLTFLLVTLLPFVLIAFWLAYDCMNNIILLKLELDVVEERRKLTDEICVKNQIGYRMDTKTKYKVLAQAPQDEKLTYISLLWKDGSAPNSLRKYYLRKRVLLKPNEELLELNRKCEKMFEEKVPEKEIAKFYIEQKEQIAQNQHLLEERIKKLRRMTNLKKETV